jgi:hypothetical protein
MLNRRGAWGERGKEPLGLMAVGLVECIPIRMAAHHSSGEVDVSKKWDHCKLNDVKIKNKTK